MMEKTMSECKSEGEHKGHICVLASEGKFQDIKKITQNPEYICFNCGRVADSKDNLCNPMPLGE
jgi:hypothetical protein